MSCETQCIKLSVVLKCCERKFYEFEGGVELCSYAEVLAILHVFQPLVQFNLHEIFRQSLVNGVNVH
jgi:hypothetical protein